MADQKMSEACSCRRKKGVKSTPKPGKRKRQTLVHNPDEEVWHEPYMHCLRKEFSQISIPCDSKIELPWKDIALPPVAMKIRANVQLNKPESRNGGLVEEAGENSRVEVELAPKESNGKMSLPWNDLLVMDMVVPPQTLRANGAPCDSTLEIPWDDLALERPIEIRPIPEEEPCGDDDVEIPWGDILVPANIVIETRKKKKHPSSKAPRSNSVNRKIRNYSLFFLPYPKVDSCATSTWKVVMTDRDGRHEDPKTSHKTVLNRDFFPGRNLSSNSNQDPVLLGQDCNAPTITNTDSDADYETSSEGPQSPRVECHRSQTSLHRDADQISNRTLVKSTLLAGDPKLRVCNDASYTILGVSDSDRKEEAEILDHVERTSPGSSEPDIRPSRGVEELEARRTEYSVASRIEDEATKSESLPVIRIAKPWGSYEYPDNHMPAERLVSDSPVDIRGKMRHIAECMDGSAPRAAPRANFFHYDNESSRSLRRDVEEREVEARSHYFEVEETANPRVCSRPTTPRTPKMISVTSPNLFSEPFNVLPIIRNPDVASDCTAPPTPSGSSSFYHYQESESPRNLASKKPSYDPLSRIEGELGPLQNELSEIRGKVRALNLDYNLSCINGIGKNWMAGSQASSHLQIRHGEDDFILGDYLGHHNQSLNFGLQSFRVPNQPSYTYEFPNRVSTPPVFRGLEGAGNSFASIASKSLEPPEDSGAQICSLEENKPDAAPATDRKLSQAYVCTSTPSSLNLEIDAEGEESAEGTEAPEIRLPEFFDKIRIVPIAYLHGMPDPPVEPVFNFAQPEEDHAFGDVGCKVLRIEHPDAPPRRGNFEANETVRNSVSLSETVFTLENTDTETSLSVPLKRDRDASSVGNYDRASDRIAVSKLEGKRSGSEFSGYSSHESPRKNYIRGLISGPEDFYD